MFLSAAQPNERGHWEGIHAGRAKDHPNCVRLPAHPKWGSVKPVWISEVSYQTCLILIVLPKDDNGGDYLVSHGVCFPVAHGGSPDPMVHGWGSGDQGRLESFRWVFRSTHPDPRPPAVEVGTGNWELELELERERELGTGNWEPRQGNGREENLVEEMRSSAITSTCRPRFCSACILRHAHHPSYLFTPAYYGVRSTNSACAACALYIVHCALYRYSVITPYL
ncbi:hypothetical protein BO71DRAFT_13661 [Aspergillus ellipticus CBS 707.79]|uniref:Uncharacterized protein n=1 Tax=Aspergillus ellipticus CBS 707.79 TaxID=1448320 RepID=A0A319F2C9_9EURO|nr:hypothetical protein BO71DRAFT_13661 [Aspergillus ellipticus CBS 707.79]